MYCAGRSRCRRLQGCSRSIEHSGRARPDPFVCRNCWGHCAKSPCWAGNSPMDGGLWPGSSTRRTPSWRRPPQAYGHLHRLALRWPVLRWPRRAPERPPVRRSKTSESPLSLFVVMGIPGPPPPPSPGIRCDVHARSRRFPGAFRALAGRHPRLHHLSRRVTASSEPGNLRCHSSRLGESSVTCWHRMATLGADPARWRLSGGGGVDFEVLGPLRVRLGDTPVQLSAPMPRMLLGVLLTRPNTPVPVDVLVDALWAGQRDPRAGKKLQLHVHRLRRALGDPDRIQYDNGGYTLRVHPGELDAERFESALAESTDVTQPARAVSLLRNALQLWRGEAFSDLVDLPLLRTEAERLAERRLAGLAQLYAAELACGHASAVVAELAELAARHPMREQLQGLLMTALYQAGRQAEALEVYQRTRAALVDQLGLEPSNELQRLERAILTGDPLLEAPKTPSIAPAQLPADITDFTGRKTQLATVAHLAGAADRSATVLITIAGQAGSGKTALAVHAAHRLRAHYPDGQLFVDLRGTQAQPLAATDVLARFLRALGVDRMAIPDDAEERAALYRSRLADRRLLILLDDAACEAQLRPLLPGTPGCAVLVTSRARLSGLGGAQRVDLDVFAPDQAIELLARVAGPQRVAAEPVSAREIVRLCGFLPLAIRVAGARLGARPHWPLSRLEADLTDEGTRLDTLRLGDLEVRASLARSYDTLDVIARRALRLLGLIEAADFAPWVTA